jgi:AcrR family transcriptional regulator
MPSSERRIQLLDTTRAIIADEGLAMVSMERVAQGAHVSKPVLYSHFANRAELLVALLEDFWASIDETLRDHTLAINDLEAFNVILVEAYFNALDRGGPAMQALLGSGSEEPEINAARRERFAQVERIWSRRYQSSLGLPEPLADIAAAVLRSAVAGAGDYWVSHSRRSRKECTLVLLAAVRGALHEVTAQAPEQDLEAAQTS